MTPYQTLSEAQVQQFIEHNYVVLEDCFPREIAQAWIDDACRRANIDLADPATYPEPHSFLGQHSGVQQQVPMREFSPKLWGAVCDLIGGEARIDGEPMVTDSFVVNFNAGADDPWRDPIQGGSWHVDGDFNHFIDSPEAGLFYLMLWTDVGPRGGPTYIAPDSIPLILRQLLDHPAGLSAYHLRTSHNVARDCRLSVPAQGKVGTVYLMHPQMLHTTSQNIDRKPRFIRNGQIPLKAPMRFDRTDPGAFSPVERCTLHQLSVERLKFTPPPEHLRSAADHDTGELLPWKYGERPSYKKYHDAV